MSFLAVFKLFHICIYNRFENTLILITRIIYDSHVLFSHLGFSIKVNKTEKPLKNFILINMRSETAKLK
jgi:hypothetical protein